MLCDYRNRSATASTGNTSSPRRGIRNRDYWYESVPGQNSIVGPGSNSSSAAIWPQLLDNYCQQYFPRSENPVKQFVDSKLLIPVIVLVCCTNICICLVLTKRHMISATNVILTAIAVADSLTGLFPLPFYFLDNFYHFYRIASSQLFGYLFYYSVVVLPTVLHTVSIWLTVSLAVQRYIYVKMPTKAKDFCSVTKSLYTIVGIILLSVGFHTQLAIVTFDYYFKVTVNNSGCDKQLILMKCNWKKDLLIYYYWSRTVLTNVIPCIMLTVFTLSLIVALQEAGKHRRSLLQTSKRKESRRAKEFYSTSKMLLIVLCLFLLVEIPNGMLITFYMILRTFYPSLMAIYGSVWTKLNLICNASIIFSYPLNFFIYCAMSRNFRETFKYIFGFTAAPDIVANVSVLKSNVKTVRTNTPCLLNKQNIRTKIANINSVNEENQENHCLKVSGHKVEYSAVSNVSKYDI